MKEIDIETWNIKTTYEWFNSFTDSTYSVTVKMDITKLVKITKETKSSFFANMLYVVVLGLNSIPEMRMRMYNGKPVIFDNVTHPMPDDKHSQCVPRVA